MQQLHRLREPEIPDEHQIDIAASALASLRYEPKINAARSFGATGASTCASTSASPEFCAECGEFAEHR